jgi:hypothetical protein
MSEQGNKIKKIISTIVSPFATASMILLIILSLLEYFRRGFVSLFLDFRVLVAVVLILWGVAIFTEESPRRRRLASILPTIALLAVLPFLYRMTMPFGRLGLITFIAGAAAVVVIIVSIWIESKN